jgi:hypothetical protein
MTHERSPTCFVADGRFFLVPAGEEVPSGDFVVVDVGGRERRVNEAALSPFEVSEHQAQVQMQARAEQAIASVTDAIAKVFGLGPTSGRSQPADLRRLAEQLGLSDNDLRRDPDAARAAFERLTSDMHVVSAAVASGDAAQLETARDRLAAHGIDLGDTLDELPGYLAALRKLDQPQAARAAAEGLRALADAIEADEQTLGRRIDEVIARLERKLGPYVGVNEEQERQRREEEYDRMASAGIAEALRAAGITPLSTGPDETSEAREEQ